MKWTCNLTTAKTATGGSGKLADKRALITGGDSGIGRAVALAFAREGADVLISHLDGEEGDAQETCRLVEEAGRKAVRVPGDIRDERQCVELVERAVSGLGGLDILVNNAAYQMSQDGIADISTEQFDRVMKTNVYAMFWLCKAAIPQLRPGSAIINTTRSRPTNHRRSCSTTRPPRPRSSISPRASRKSWRRGASG